MNIRQVEFTEALHLTRNEETVYAIKKDNKSKSLSLFGGIPMKHIDEYIYFVLEEA